MMEQLTKISKRLVLVVLLIMVATTYWKNVTNARMETPICKLKSLQFSIKMAIEIVLRYGWKKVYFYSNFKVAIDFINDNLK